MILPKKGEIAGSGDVDGAGMGQIMVQYQWNMSLLVNIYNWAGSCVTAQRSNAAKSVASGVPTAEVLFMPFDRLYWMGVWGFISVLSLGSRINIWSTTLCLEVVHMRTM